jgi:Mg/Co/Ni transporter MgtE
MNSTEYLKINEIRNQIETFFDFIFEKLLIKTKSKILTKMDYDTFTWNFERIPFFDSKEIFEMLLQAIQKPER